MRRERVVLKLGGSVLTKKAEDRFELNTKRLANIAAEIIEALEARPAELLLVHGAGPFGHVVAKRGRADKPEELCEDRLREAFVAATLSVRSLNLRVAEELRSSGLFAVPFSTSTSCLLEGEKLRVFLKPLEACLGLDLVPLLCGDVVPTSEGSFAIVSGDRLAVELALRLRAKRILMATDVEGVYERDPKLHAKAKLLRQLRREDLPRLELRGPAAGTDVTGGMRHKVEELLRAAQRGVEARIFSGLVEGGIRKALLGEEVGTKICS